jgi:hypothetical protein
MIIAVGSLVYIRMALSHHEELCVTISEGRPEFLGPPSEHYYYRVYCFATREVFLAFDYEMTHVGSEDRIPYFTEG